MIYLDTSALVRFFTADEPFKAAQVKKLLKTESEIGIADVVFSELDYVLRKSYGLKREQVIIAFKLLLAKTSCSAEVHTAVRLYEQTTHSIADCIIVAESFGNQLASFDENLLKVTGVSSYW